MSLKMMRTCYRKAFGLRGGKEPGVCLDRTECLKTLNTWTAAWSGVIYQVISRLSSTSFRLEI